MASITHAASAAEEPCGRRRLDGWARSYVLWLIQEAINKERDGDEEHVLGAAERFRVAGGFHLAGFRGGFTRWITWLSSFQRLCSGMFLFPCVFSEDCWPYAVAEPGELNSNGADAEELQAGLLTEPSEKILKRVKSADEQVEGTHVFHWKHLTIARACKGVVGILDHPPS